MSDQTETGKAKPSPEYIRVKKQQHKRVDNGEKPIRCGPVWILAEHAETPEDEKRIRAEGQAALHKALDKYKK